MTDLIIKTLEKKHHKIFNKNPEYLFSSPGRIEVVGNHTDHQGGKVLAAAISLNILATVSKRDDNIIKIYSQGYELKDIIISDTEKREDEKGTSEGIVRGILKYFELNNRKVSGFSAVMNSTIPNGAGVSSSSAFEVLLATILNDLNSKEKIDPIFAARASQFAENEYFRKPSGMLDQTIIALGGIQMLDFFDKNNIGHKECKWNFDDLNIYVINTKGSHAGLTSDYAAIVDDMATIAMHFNKKLLSEVDKDEFFNSYEELKSKYTAPVAERAMHYFTEIDRVVMAFDAINNNNEKLLLDCINESGESSKKYLKNLISKVTKSTVLVDSLDKVKNLKNVVAKRVHGGGFAGTILVIANKNIDFTLKRYFGIKNVSRVKIEKYGARLIKCYN